MGYRSVVAGLNTQECQATLDESVGAPHCPFLSVRVAVRRRNPYSGKSWRPPIDACLDVLCQECLRIYSGSNSQCGKHGNAPQKIRTKDLYWMLLPEGHLM